ncbi:F-box/LRR-repeat MAX2 homolog A [Cynara cardunculus var. scolymus]|uniref:Leucine-rich repeat, cysteine-containing subtype n=1 Tax=Cynara cardunculus var. scolymus TaxID=59895 RepID=A0A103XDT3_CYNCS|nr:F-box/LRR-repeat MAX2 homolog A [Cynara cardunculus var. scolymus]KVH88814.1 Leucine-rich repeat, cysteine-containing subtype [Cynara cardunculus var. scolymus]
MAVSTTTTTINDLPDVLLSNIIAAVSDVRTRNAASLVSTKWLLLERSTRTALTLRGNARDLLMLPSCFRSVTHLDLSLLSPWGHPLLSCTATAATTTDPALFAHLLRQSFPNVQSLVIYSRNPFALQLLAPQWSSLSEIKLVRWHQRPPQLPPGADILPILENCRDINSLDLSSFYCWTDDIPPALKTHPQIAAKLTFLNLLNPSFPDGFKAQEVEEISKACPNLKKLLIACMFDPRYIGFVGDETLLSISINCPKLSLLHLADPLALLNARTDPNTQGFTPDDASITVATLIEMFSGLPLMEELTLDVCNNIRDTAPAMEILNSRCPKLRSLKLGNFHGISMPVESKLDGIALCQRLESLSIRNVADLTDMGLIAIARGCSKLVKFEIQGCKNITVRGMRTFVCLLNRTLIDVKISCCKNLGAASSLKALEPIQDRIRRLHIDCIWESFEESENLDELEYSFVLDEQEESDDLGNERKKRKLDFDLNDSSNRFQEKTWEKLERLSLWFSVGEFLTPLLSAGLEDCPNLEEICIRVEGDCRHLSKPKQREFGLRSLALYPKLSKMQLDCGDTIGYAHTAPSGQMDLSLWERFYLFGIGALNLDELDYWPPQDRDVNQRSLSLPAAGLLQECPMLRKLFIHGTAHEHFLMFLLRIPNLRDVQLQEDYYPAPENDMSTEMRANSCSRFEDALNRRQIDD